MSGLPYNTRLDMAKSRQAYLANLKLRAELDDKNLQANKIYVKTGQLPVEPTDTRSLTEKLADVERLKIDIRGKLQEITDGEQAGRIVENLNPDELIFLLQNFQPIKDQMKRNYAVGVPAEAFIDYLRRYIDKFNLTQGVELGLQQSSATELLANQRLILSQMVDVNDLDRIITYIRDAGIQDTQLGRNLKDNIDELKNAITFLNNRGLNQTTFNNIENPIEKSQILELLNNISDDMVTNREMRKILGDLDKADSRGDNQEIIQILGKLQEITNMGQDLSEQIVILKKMIDENKPIDYIPLPTAPVSEATVIQGDFPEPPSLLNKEIAQQYKTIEELKGIETPLNTKGKLLKYYDTMFKYIKKEVGDIGSGDFAKNNIFKYASQANTTELLQLVSILNGVLRKKMYDGTDITDEAVRQHYGRGIKGKGISRVRPSQVFQSDIDYTKGIQSSAKFVPIGRYLINKRQLDKDIIAIKRPAGSTIPNLPSERVSTKLGGVFRKIIGGGLPTYDELSNLTNDEKVYLHKVAKETRIDDKLSIPTPKKDEDERDINQFEILKGQILSGNDNIELVKKFKTIILKLSRKDLIPKTQVKDLLLDLASLGH